jgi:hypothetical protein
MGLIGMSVCFEMQQRLGRNRIQGAKKVVIVVEAARCRMRCILGSGRLTRFGSHFLINFKKEPVSYNLPTVISMTSWKHTQHVKFTTLNFDANLASPVPWQWQILLAETNLQIKNIEEYRELGRNCLEVVLEAVFIPVSMGGSALSSYHENVHVYAYSEADQLRISLAFNGCRKS